MNKVKLLLLNEDGDVIETHHYRSLKAIEKELGIEYFSLRAVWMMSAGKKVKSLHPFNQELYKRYRILNDFDEIA